MGERDGGGDERRKVKIGDYEVVGPSASADLATDGESGM